MRRSLLIALLILVLASSVMATGCGAGYKEISQEEAMQMMEEGSGYLILDVRRADEFAEGHIPGAVNVSNEDIQAEEEQALAALPDKDQLLFVYCRTGNRSKQASRKLVALGYTNVYEFGGISTWEGEIVTE